jgi:ubiquinone/menaquinone biosynthesis C-methylase UbiE
MPADTITSYDIPERVCRYDADMDVMHPLRHKMIEVALDVLPFGESAPLRVLDLGAGTCVFTGRLLEEFRGATVTAVDGAESMPELATPVCSMRSSAPTRCTTSPRKTNTTLLHIASTGSGPMDGF